MSVAWRQILKNSSKLSVESGASLRGKINLSLRRCQALPAALKSPRIILLHATRQSYQRAHVQRDLMLIACFMMNISVCMSSINSVGNVVYA